MLLLLLLLSSKIDWLSLAVFQLGVSSNIHLMTFCKTVVEGSIHLASVYRPKSRLKFTQFTSFYSL